MALSRRSSLPIMSATGYSDLSDTEDRSTRRLFSSHPQEINRTGSNTGLYELMRSRRSSLSSTLYSLETGNIATSTDESICSSRKSSLSLRNENFNNHIAEKRFLFTQINTVCNQMAAGQGNKTTASMSDIETAITRCQKKRKHKRKHSTTQLQLPVLETDENENDDPQILIPRFSTNLSSEAQYAILKDYDDQLIERLKVKYPDKSHQIQRGKTPSGRVLFMNNPDNVSTLHQGAFRLHLSKYLNQACYIKDHIRKNEEESASSRVFSKSVQPQHLVKNFMTWSRTWKKEFITGT